MDERSATSCVWARSLIGSNTMLCQHSLPTPTSLGQGCNLPPALLAARTGSFTCHCGNTGWSRHWLSESARKVNSGEENVPAAPAGTRARNLSITSPALYQQAVPFRSCVSNKMEIALLWMLCYTRWSLPTFSRSCVDVLLCRMLFTLFVCMWCIIVQGEVYRVKSIWAYLHVLFSLFCRFTRTSSDSCIANK